VPLIRHGAHAAPLCGECQLGRRAVETDHGVPDPACLGSRPIPPIPKAPPWSAASSRRFPALIRSPAVRRTKVSANSSGVLLPQAAPKHGLPAAIEIGVDSDFPASDRPDLGAAIDFAPTERAKAAAPG